MWTDLVRTCQGLKLSTVTDKNFVFDVVAENRSINRTMRNVQIDQLRIGRDLPGNTKIETLTSCAPL